MQCQKILDTGKPCKMAALKGQDFCFKHSPTTTKERLLAVIAGGLQKQITVSPGLEKIDIKEPRDIVYLLSTVISEVRSGALQPQIANTIGFLSGHLLRALELSDSDNKMQEVHAVLVARKPIKRK